METTFIYNGKTITTPNLQKKLKRMKITEADIEIIPNPTKEETKSELDIPLENYHAYKYPDQQLWHIYITDNPPDTTVWNNQILERDVAYETVLQRTLRSQLRNGLINN